MRSIHGYILSSTYNTHILILHSTLSKNEPRLSNLFHIRFFALFRLVCIFSTQPNFFKTIYEVKFIENSVFAINSTMQKCRFIFTVITLHLEQQSNEKDTVNNCKLDYSYSTVLCTFLSCVPYLQCIEI